MFSKRENAVDVVVLAVRDTSPLPVMGSEAGNVHIIYSAHRDGAAHECKGAGGSKKYLVSHRLEAKQSQSVPQVIKRKIVFSRRLGIRRYVGVIRVAFLRSKHGGTGGGHIFRSRFQWLRTEGTDG
jgi:hypothetical protein